LLADGYLVRVLDTLDFGIEPLQELYGHPRFELLRGDCRQVEPVVRAVSGAAAVVHLGGIVGDPACAVNEKETLETNLGATRLLADACRALNVPRLVFASSCSVYGITDEIVDEGSPLRPVSLYAATKADSERLLLDRRDEHFHPIILRLGTAFGWSYRPRFDLIVNLLLARAVFEKKIVIHNGQQWRPFVHVQDIARAFRTALRAPLPVASGEIFNVGDDALNFTLAQVAELITELIPGLAVECVENADLRNYRVCFDRIRRRLGFRCRVDLRTGLRGLQEALHGGLVADYRDARYSNVHHITQRHRDERPKSGNGHLELTTLQFVKNSVWRQALCDGSFPGASPGGPGAAATLMAFRS
jgi:nucleoside-diphosphate-sugar epimerase